MKKKAIQIFFEAPPTPRLCLIRPSGQNDFPSPKFISTTCSKKIEKMKTYRSNSNMNIVRISPQKIK